MPEPGPEKQGLLVSKERQAVGLMLLLSTVTLFLIALVDIRDEALGTTLMSSIGLHLVGARAPAILFCMMRDMSPLSSLFFNFYIEVIITGLSFYGFVLIVREGVEYRILHLAAKQAEAVAQARKSWVKRYELFGLFLLVMAPLPMTGPVTGAVIGYLLNLKPWRIFAVVLSGSFAMQAVYVLMGQALLSSLIEFQKAHRNEAMMVLGFVILVVTFFHIRGIVKLVADAFDGSNDS